MSLSSLAQGGLLEKMVRKGRWKLMKFLPEDGEGEEDEVLEGGEGEAADEAAEQVEGEVV